MPTGGEEHETWTDWVTYAEAAAATSIPVGTLRRMSAPGALSMRGEREELGVPDGSMSIHEVFRADAFRHFKASRGRPDDRTRIFLGQHRFGPRPWVLVLRPERTVTMTEPARLLELVSQPGLFAVYDPAPLVATVGLLWDG